MANKRLVLGAVASVVLAGGGWVIATASGSQDSAATSPKATPPPAGPPVQVATVATREVPESTQLTGRLAAVQHVELRARVGGHVRAVRFREGSLVKKGQVLFELDARPFQAAVARAKAQLHQAQERRALAERKAARAQRLRADDVISQAELETLAAEHAEAGAAVEAARAWLRTATIDLADTRVRAPIDGRVGQALVTAGNLVGGGTTGASLLTTIVSIDPLHVYFDIDEPTYRRFASAKRDGVPVEVTLGDEPAGREARLDYIGNHVDPKTGTARARAVLANSDGTLAPGLFARVRLATGAARSVALVRDDVIGTDPQGRYVLVVKPDGVVEQRRVRLGEIVDGLRAITEGLAAGDRVIVKGMARPGMTVTATVVGMEG